MSKKVLILSSSPRRGGNSDTLCDEFLRGAQEAGHEVEKIFLKDKTIHYCTGCGVCYGGAKPCPQRDTMSAQMKTLIDRCCAGYLEIRDKEFYFIVAAAETSVAAMERTIDGFRGFLDCLDNPQEKGVVYGVGAWHKGDIQGKPAMKQAYEMGRNI